MPTERPASADLWQAEYEEFLSKNWEERQIRKKRIAQAVSFLSKNPTAPLKKRVDFLTFKGLNEDEIEEAFEQSGARKELLRVLENSFTPEDHGPTAEERAAQVEAENKKTPFSVGQRVLGYVQENHYFPAIVVDIDESRQDKNQDVLKIEWYHVPDNPRAEQTKWCAPGFKGVVADIIPKAETINVDEQVLVCIPKEHEDIFSDAIVLATHDDDDTFDVEFNDCTQHHRIPLNYMRTIGHPRQLALLSSDDIVGRRAKEEAIRKARVASAPSFPSIGNKERPVRTQEIMALMTGEADARRVDLLVKETDEPDITQEERRNLGTFIRSFIRYRRLDIDEAPPLCRRFHDFISVFGDTAARSSMKVMPKGSPSQLRTILDTTTTTTTTTRSQQGSNNNTNNNNNTQQHKNEQEQEGGREPDEEDEEEEEGAYGVGYGFNLSHLKRHPTCPHLFEFNPILEVAHQCLKLNQMFVDPDFPPSWTSLHGPATFGDKTDPNLESLKDPDTIREEERRAREMQHTLEDMEGQFEWRRVSEVVHHPRAHITGTNPYKMSSGAFSNPWLPCIFALVPESQEFDEMFSPAEETSLYGAYTIRLFVDGRWYFVLVDDFIPVHTKGVRPACVMSANPNELWPLLLEKVYAKLEGSYASIKRGRKVFIPERVYEDLTGGCGIRDEYTLFEAEYRNAWFENMMGRHEDRAFCTQLSSALTSGTFTTERKLNRLGIELGTYHYVRDVLLTEIETEDGEERFKFVHTVNPWAGLSISEEAQERILVNVPRHIIDDVLKNHKDREDEKRPKGLWMPLNEYMRRFESSLTCFNFNNWQRACLQCSFSGRSGGSKWQHDNKGWRNNPQFYINVLNYGQLAIQVRLLDRRYTNKSISGTMLNMSLCASEGFETIINNSDGLIASSNTIDFQDQYATTFPSVFIQLTVNSGGYVCVPEIGSYQSDEDFVLKVWATSIFQVRWMNDPGNAANENTAVLASSEPGF
eukprot:TRINITY_DN67909_c5_g3_i7.p1 TRINITY_DN67909_c5_g3~~TRINITY_DN67909_c5_g3_i7.p1  ORF type:complete len:984 (-),score=104.07 TRINITY_DN67909_c5_g3_i7:148-3099(-)